MENLIKIQAGTGRLTGEGLCATCSESFIREDDVICRAMHYVPTRITRPVYKCNQYYNSSLPSISTMKEIAWTLVTHGDGKSIKIGFTPPKKKDNDD